MVVPWSGAHRNNSENGSALGHDEWRLTGYRAGQGDDPVVQIEVMPLLISHASIDLRGREGDVYDAEFADTCAR